MKSIISIALFACLGTAFAGNGPVSDPALNAKAISLMNKKSFSGFLENKGQMQDMNGNPAPHLLFRSDAHGMNLYVTETGLSYLFLKYNKDPDKTLAKEDRIRIEWDRIDLTLKGASIKKENVIKEGQSKSFSQYFFGHCPDGVTDVRTYEKITVKEVYPGIDWVLYNSTEKGFKYDFIVHPGADPDQIQLLYSSKEKININEAGAIQVTTAKGNLTENAPETFQDGKLIESKFKLISQSKNNFGGYDNLVSFHLPTLPLKGGAGGGLLIDPQLTWATFIGGTVHEGAQSITCDPAGNITIVGYLASLDFPVLNPGGGAYYQGTNLAQVTAFIINFNNAGVLLWSTYYGGSGGEEGNYVTNDANGNIFVTGYTSSTNFPTQNAGGGSYYQATSGGMDDSYILKFNNAGVRQWATYYGGNDADHGRSLNIDPTGNLLATGFTSSTNFPVVNPGGGAFFQGTIASPAGASNTYVLKFTNAGVPIWATYIGGNVGDGGMSIATDAAGNIFHVGYTRSPNFPTLNPGGGAFFQGAPTGARNGYIMRFTSAGVLTWSTYYGGNSSDVTACVAIDGSGNAFVCGSGYSNNLSMVNPGGGAYYQAAPSPGGMNELFILKFTNAGVQTWGTYFGGNGDDGFYCGDQMVIDKCDNVYVGCNTNSTNAPVLNYCATGFNDASLTGLSDQFLAKFSNNGTQMWGTYLGGDGRDFSEALATDNAGNIFMSGEWSDVTNSASYPLTNPGGGAHYDNSWAGGIDDSYVVKFEPAASTPTLTSTQAGCSCTGSATVTLPANACSGPTYTYAWSNGTTTGPTTGLSSTISNLCAGNYSVVISYGACTTPDTLTVIITGSAGGYTVNITPANATCSASNGSATPAITGGTAPFTYSWSNGQTSTSATGLAAGNYTCVITDASGCTNTQTFSISSTGGYSVNITPTAAVCSAANGSAVANITGGTAPFSYLWNNGQTTSAASSLIAGTYTCTTTDASGCTNTQTVSVTASGAITSTITTSNITCNGGSNGNATIAPTSGAGPYTYLWSNGQSTSAASNLSAGTYSATVIDANGCSSTQSISITQPTAITATITSTQASCNSSDGTATAAATGGSGSYTYLWNPTAASTATATGLAAGNYSCTITDANGCTQISSTSITNSNGPTATAAGSTTIPFGGSATLTASGGVTYSWTPTYALNNATSANPVASPTITTEYCVYVFDANGCSDSACITVFVTPEPVACGEFYIPNAFSPNEDSENDVFKAYIEPSCVSEFKLVIYNRWGEKVFESTDVTNSWDGKLRDVISNPGVYAYYCKAVLTNGKEIFKEGNVSLIR